MAVSRTLSKFPGLSVNLVTIYNGHVYGVTQRLKWEKEKLAQIISLTNSLNHLHSTSSLNILLFYY